VPAADSTTAKDRAAAARLWAFLRSFWDRTEDLATAVGVCRSAVQQYATGDRDGGWATLRIALRETARRHPEGAVRLVEGLAAELLDLRGRWTPEEALPVGSWETESADVTIAHAALAMARRAGDPVAVARAARVLVREAEEAAKASVVQ
jgi:hypothetical protein